MVHRQCILIEQNDSADFDMVQNYVTQPLGSVFGIVSNSTHGYAQ